MTILFLDEDPYLAARWLADNDIKQALRTSIQILTNAYYETNEDETKLLPASEKYKLFQFYSIDHDCDEWASETLANWSWVVFYGMSLCIDYNLRFREVYPKVLLFRWFFDNPPSLPIKNQTEFPIGYFAIIDHNLSAVQQYRNYYMKKENLKWELGIPKPSWYRTKGE